MISSTVEDPGSQNSFGVGAYIYISIYIYRERERLNMGSWPKGYAVKSGVFSMAHEAMSRQEDFNSWGVFALYRDQAAWPSSDEGHWDGQ